MLRLFFSAFLFVFMFLFVFISTPVIAQQYQKLHENARTFHDEFETSWRAMPEEQRYLFGKLYGLHDMHAEFFMRCFAVAEFIATNESEQGRKALAESLNRSFVRKFDGFSEAGDNNRMDSTTRLLHERATGEKYTDTGDWTREKITEMVQLYRAEYFQMGQESYNRNRDMYSNNIILADFDYCQEHP